MVVAQQENMGNWVMYFGTNKLSDQWSVHTEFQYRNHTLASFDTEQLLLRAGVNYHLSQTAFATVGYAFVPSFTFESEQKRPEVIEHRLWQQFIQVSKVANVKLEHRYRLEQRWVNTQYRNRFRYRLMAFVPLNKKQKQGKLFLGIYDEIFINSKNTFFDRNRFYMGLGYQMSQISTLQVGILHQQLNNYGKLYFQFSLTVR